MNKLFEAIDRLDIFTLNESFRDYDKQIYDLEDQIDELKNELVIYEPDEPEFTDINNKIDQLQQQIEEVKSKQQDDYRNEMKNLPPKSNKTDFPGFDITQADLLSRTDFIPGNKNRDYALDKGNYIDSYIAEITPEQYLELCSKYGWGKEMEYSLDNIWKHLPSSDVEYIDKMADAMKNGTIFRLPFIDIKDHSQEGRHRALAAIKAGIKTIPCLIIC